MEGRSVPSETLIRQLEERRSAHVAQMNAILAPSETEKRQPTKDEFESWSKLDTEVSDIEGQVEKLKAAGERERRAAAANSGNAHVADPGSAGDPRAVVTSEPTVYGKYSGRSFFLDQARAEIQHDPEARKRLDQHQRELDVELPKRREARDRGARDRMDTLLTPHNRREERSLNRWVQETGGSTFVRGGEVERRFISRTDGSGGYLVPPLWLIDEYVPYLRAGRVFADQWTSMPLPAGTDSINIPRLVLGTATGPQTADGGPVPGRDAQDSFVNALVRTVAGQQDAAIQLLDQSPVAFDRIIFKDLMLDHAMQLSGQLMVGSGANGQLTGLYPQGTITGGSTPGQIINTVTNTTAATLWVGSATSFYAGVAQMLSKISRTRFRPPTGLITNPAVWYALASSADTTNRPIVMPAQQGLGYNAAAGDDDGPVSEGPVGHILGVPWILDPNIPLTFGGTVAPSIGAISQGNVAPIDGSGGSPDFTPAIAAVWDDLYLWEGELRSRTLSEVLSGTLQVRFQVYSYCASMPNRYQNSSGTFLSYGNANSGSTTGAALSTAGGLSGF